MFLFIQERLIFAFYVLNTVLRFATTWMDVEGRMLSDIVSRRKTNIIGLHSYVEFKKQNLRNKTSK